MSKEQPSSAHSFREKERERIIEEVRGYPFPKTLVSPFVFRGVHEKDRVDIENLYFNFPVEQIKERPEIFFDAAKNIYTTEKLLNPITSDTPREIDMSNIEDLSYAESHLKVHAVTGLPELGTSNTKSIPYWDRQGVIAGFAAKFDAKLARFFQEESDIESVNVIRAFIEIFIPKYNYARLAVSNLESQMNRGQVTLQDIGELFEAQCNTWIKIRDTYREVIIAKIKHLFYCLDKVQNQKIRTHCLNGILNLLKDTDIKEEEIGINLGVDGGVTSDTYRPGYHIKYLAQLNHYGEGDIILPEEQSCIWTFKEIVESLGRPTGADTTLKEPASYMLDWRFTKGKEYVLEEKIGRVVESVPVTGGLVHEVTRLNTGNGIFFLKRRSPSLVKVEGIVVEKEDVRYEYSALRFFSGAFPVLFPKPILVNTEKGYLLMTNALADSKQLIEEFNDIDEERMLQITNQLGKFLGNIHHYSRGKIEEVDFNPNNDFEEILNYRYGYHNIEILSKVIADICKNKDCVLLGGLSPKNILVNDKNVAFVDLETACMGNPVFDYAFCIAHILLHNIKNPSFGIRLLQTFESAYSLSGNRAFDSTQITVLILGTFLYRLDNKRVPYPLGITEDERIQIVSEIRSRLNKADIGKDDLFQFI